MLIHGAISRVYVLVTLTLEMTYVHVKNSIGLVCRNVSVRIQDIKTMQCCSGNYYKTEWKLHFFRKPALKVP